MPRGKLRAPDSTIRSAERRVGVLPDFIKQNLPSNVRRLAFTISGIHQISQIRSVLDSLNNAIRDGQTFSQWQQTVDIKAFTDLDSRTQRLVFRQHVNTSYNSGVIDFARENKNIAPYLRYQAILDGNVRDEHAALDGLTRPTDDPIWNTYTPPIDFNCRCTLVALTRAKAARGGTRTNTTDRVARGKGLTPKSVANEAVRQNRPGKGFNFDKRNPIPKMSNYYRQRAKELPTVIRSALAEYLIRRDPDAATYITINKDKFE